MGKGKKRDEPSIHVGGDSIDTNKPQDEERDLEDLLKDIEDQYNNEEETKKSRRKAKRKAKANVDQAVSSTVVVEEQVFSVDQKSLDKEAAPVVEAKPKKANKKPSKKPKGLVVKVEDKTKEVVAPAVVSDVAAKPDVKKSKSKQVEKMKEFLAKQKELEDKMRREEEERVRLEEEFEKKKEEEVRLEKEKRLKKKEKEKERLRRKKESGQYLTREQRLKKERALAQLEGRLSDRPFPRPKKKEKVIEEDVEEEAPVAEIVRKPEVVVKLNDLKDCWDDESGHEDEDESVVAAEVPVAEDSSSSSSEESDDDDEYLRSIPAGLKRAQARIEQRFNRQKSQIGDYRSVVICVMGHVDTGKTKLLDNLRRSHVQDGEAGGITQQIGATNVPKDTIIERIRHCVPRSFQLRIPGFLIIDTPGHESFKNLRSRGSSLCDIAVLIVDIMHGLEPQTIESIELLRSRRCPFIVALNKIDRLFGWRSSPQTPVRELIYGEDSQTQMTVKDFESRVDSVVAEMAEQFLNAKLIWNRVDNDDREYVYMVPVSAVSGDGVGDLLKAIVDVCQNQNEVVGQYMTPPLGRKLFYSEELKCTVMEVKEIGGLGTTIDVCLVTGRLRHGDTIVLAGQDGPITTSIRGLLMPAANKELRVKAQYQLYKEVKGTRGIKIAAKNLDRALAGIPLYVAARDDEIEVFEKEVAKLVQDVLGSIKLAEVGVYVQASTLGSLEALLEFLHENQIPHAGINIGCVHRLDVTKASIMLQKDPKWAVILAFDVKVEKDAQDVADHLGVKIFTADIIYHLFDKFMAYNDELKNKNKEKFRNVAVFPCKLKIIPQFVFNSRDPIVVGVSVERGFLKIGTPLLAIKNDDDDDNHVEIGVVTSMEINRKPVDYAKQGQEVCIKIESPQGEAPKMIGRHFDTGDAIISKISRESINAVKEYFRDEMQKGDWHLMIELKNTLKIL